MKFELCIESASGDKTKIYSPVLLEDGVDETLYERFIRENKDAFKREVDNLDNRLNIMGKETGLLAEFFEPGGRRKVWNIFKFKDKPKTKLRLYFILLESNAIILGGGGFKPKGTRTHQEVPKLDNENELLGLIAETLQSAKKAGHFGVNDDGSIFTTTNYIYNTDNYANSKKKK